MRENDFHVGSTKYVSVRTFSKHNKKHSTKLTTIIGAQCIRELFVANNSHVGHHKFNAGQDETCLLFTLIPDKNFSNDKKILFISKRNPEKREIKVAVEATARVTLTMHELKHNFHPIFKLVFNTVPLKAVSCKKQHILHLFNREGNITWAHAAIHI